MYRRVRTRRVGADLYSDLRNVWTATGLKYKPAKVQERPNTAEIHVTGCCASVVHAVALLAGVTDPEHGGTQTWTWDCLTGTSNSSWQITVKVELIYRCLHTEKPVASPACLNATGFGFGVFTAVQNVEKRSSQSTATHSRGHKWLLGQSYLIKSMTARSKFTVTTRSFP